MLRETCAKCHCELECEQNDVALVHFTDNDEEKGVDAIRYGDLYRCNQCGCKVVVGLGRQIGFPQAKQEDLQRMVKFAKEVGKLIELIR